MNTLNKSDKILVTGGFGFLGTHLVEELRSQGYNRVTRMRKKYCDLRSQQQTNTYFKRHKPNIIIHLAGTVGGIGANKVNPGLFFYDNIQMGINVLEYSRIHSVKKLIQIGTVCSYPKFSPIPFVEEDLWMGFPEETNAPYGIAKRSLLEMGCAYRTQYGLDVVNLIPVNLYGPGESYDPERSHVIPALILKFWNAINSSFGTVEVWGTGKASREFLFVKDCAKAIILAMEKYNSSDPVNIGSGKEITIMNLVQLIANKMGFMGSIRFDHTKPDGQPRRCLNTDKAKDRFGFTADTKFEDGIDYTIKWFRRHVDEITGSLRV